ncbi:hypothetical protein VNI00_016874 [Paramarasmius palmivorus]|uniref:F-box domain-containing protein n=1 Tax=Paramarasmius palmivorus TaxID=297713 RepID=A0AAW0B9P1_9AGAR
MSYTPIAPVPGLTAKHEPLNSEECFAGKPQQSESLYYTSPSPSLPPSSRSQSIPPQHEVCGSSSLVQTLLHAHIMQAVNQKQLNDASVSIFRSTTDVENTSIPIPNSIDVSQSHSGEHAKLFPELWSEIFANCLSTPVGDDWPRGCSQYEKQLLTLAGVCSYWRQILLCAAVYWRWIQYAPSSRSGKDSDVDKITTWLSRSRKAPLHIALTFKHRPSLMSGRTSASPARVVDTIFATSHRWESLFISCQGFSPISLLAPVSGNLRALRKIEFDSVLSDMDNGDAVFGLFEGSQRLTSISALKGGHSSGLEVLKVLDGMTMALNHLTSVNLTPRIGSAQEFFAIPRTLTQCRRFDGKHRRRLTSRSPAAS